MPAKLFAGIKTEDGTKPGRLISRAPCRFCNGRLASTRPGKFGSSFLLFSYFSVFEKMRKRERKNSEINATFSTALKKKKKALLMTGKQKSCILEIYKQGRLPSYLFWQNKTPTALKEKKKKNEKSKKTKKTKNDSTNTSENSRSNQNKSTNKSVTNHLSRHENRDQLSNTYIK